MRSGPVNRIRTRFRNAMTPARSDERGGILLAIAVGWLIILGTRFLVPALLPQIRTTFELDNSGAGVAVTIIWACYGLMQFPTGVLIDRVGERLLLSCSLLLAGVSVVALSVAPTLLFFLLGCGLFGLGTGLYGPPRGTALSRIFSDHSGTAFGLTLAAGSIGSALFPLLAGLAMVVLTWRVTIGLLVVPFVTTAVFAWMVIPASEADESDVDEVPLRETMLAVLRAITDRNVFVAFSAIILMMFTFQGLTAFLPTYLIEQKNFSQGTASGLFAVMFIGGAGFQIFAGNAADQFGERQVLAATAAIGVFTVGLLPLVDGLVPLVVLVTVMGSRMAIAPVSNSYIIDLLPNQITGTTWGLIRTSVFLIASTGSSFVGALADLGYFDHSFYVLSVLSAGACALYLLLPNQAAA